jgi:HEAT repeat protein
MTDMYNTYQNEAVETTELSKEELALATDVLLSVVKTSKGFRMYLPNNPLLTRFVGELKERLGRYLAEYGDLRLEIDQFELRCKGKAVYENSDPKESMAFRMFSDGIRYLIISEGIEEHELCTFLDIVGKDCLGDLDDDIVTLLWEKDLPHLSYILTDDFIDFDSETTGSAAPRAQQEQIKKIYQSIPAESAPVPPLLIPQQIITLSDEEAEWLSKTRDGEGAKKPLHEVVQILMAILAGETDQEMYRDFIDIMTKLTEDLVNADEIRYSLNLMVFMSNLSRNVATSPSHRQMALTALTGIISTKTIEILAHIVDTTDQMTPEELLEFLRLLGKPFLGKICDLLGFVEKMKMRKVVIQALIELGADTPEIFYPYLNDQRWFVVRNMLFILGKIPGARVFDQIAAQISHREPAVRKEVFACMERSSDARAKSYLLRFLRDESAAIRVRALQTLANNGSTFALKPIMAITSSDQFAERDTAEKKVTYESLGTLGGEQLLPHFREMLTKKYWFNKAKEKESVICAVAGLSRIMSEEAVKLLEEARAARKDELGELIEAALVQQAALSRK